MVSQSRGTYQPKNDFTLTMQRWEGAKAFDDAPELSDTDTTFWNSCYKNSKHPSAVRKHPHRPTSLILNTSEGIGLGQVQKLYVKLPFPSGSQGLDHANSDPAD